MVELAGEQLTLDVGGGRLPSTSSFKVAGSIDSVSRELKRGAEVQVMVVGPDGEIIVSAYGKVRGVGFKDCESRGVEWTERIHTIKLD